MKLINIIGAGRLGKTIGKLLTLNAVGSVQGICNKSFDSSLNACGFIGNGKPFVKISTLPPADITFITTPDKYIKGSARELAKSDNLKSGSLIAHCSGVLASSELESLKAKKCRIVSVHPMYSFASPEISVNQFKGTYCAIEGDPDAEKSIGTIFSKIGGMPYCILGSKKNKYHASGVIASNYLVTLCKQAHKCLVSSGVEPDFAMKIISSLMKSTTDNLSTTLSVEKSLTGPVKRGDIETLLSHLSALEDDERLNSLYRFMGALTVDIASHNTEKSNAILEVFRSLESFIIIDTK